jgi:hypothetical protein
MVLLPEKKRNFANVSSQIDKAQENSRTPTAFFVNLKLQKFLCRHYNTKSCEFPEESSMSKVCESSNWRLTLGGGNPLLRLICRIKMF